MAVATLYERELAVLEEILLEMGPRHTLRAELMAAGRRLNCSLDLRSNGRA